MAALFYLFLYKTLVLAFFLSKVELIFLWVSQLFKSQAIGLDNS